MTDKNKLMMWGSIASVLTAGVLIVLKIIAFMMTASVAILASLFDSVQDLMTSLINFISVRQSVQPPDKKHRFGHGKAQAIGSFVQGLILAGSSAWLFWESVTRLGTQTPLTYSIWGIGIIFVSLILTGCLIRFQVFVIRQTDSLSIKADNAHYNGDFIMNMGVLTSLIFSYTFSISWIDSIFGIVVSFYLLKSAYAVLKCSLAMLMDEELPSHVHLKIENQVYTLKEVKDIHDLRTRQAGCQMFIQMTLVLDGTMPLTKAHIIADKTEKLIREIYSDAEVMIHLEPEK